MERGTPIYKTSCDECGSSDANQVFLNPENDTENSFCFACEVYKELGEGKARPIMKEEEIVDLSSISSLPSQGVRGINKQVMSLFGVKTALSTSDGSTITDHYYPAYKSGVLTGYEHRKVEGKVFRSIGDRKGNVELFGQAIAKKNNHQKLFITEGCLDAMSLFQAIVDNTSEKFKKYKPSVVSLTRGASSGVKDLMNNRDFLEGFKEVILVLDNDEAGEKAKRDILKVFKDFKVVNLPLKDANAMLEAGRGKELANDTMWNFKVERQGKVLDVVDFMEFALQKPKMGISFPWPTVTKACFGIRPNNIHIVGAAPKIGKTDHQHQLVEHLTWVEKVKVGMFDLENAPAKTAKKLAGKHDKIDYTRPDIKYEVDDLRATLEDMNGKVRFYDRSASRDWDDIRIAITEMHLLDDINIFIIDPLTALVSRYSSSEANDKLNEIMTDMADLVLMYPITIFCYSHVNPKPKGKKSHEEGGKVYSNEFTGSRAMEKWAHYGHGISRDRSDDCPSDRRNISTFTMLFDRDFGQNYNCDVKFDEATITYLEIGGMRRV